MKSFFLQHKLIIVLTTLSLIIFLSVGYFFSSNFEIIANGETSDNVLKQDLGEISMGDGIKKISFSYTNYTDQSLLINNLYTSCMCTKAKLEIGSNQSRFAGMIGHTGGLMPINPQMTLKSGETAIIDVEFDPNAHGPEAVGPINRTITMHTNSNELPTIEFTFTGDVIK